MRKIDSHNIDVYVLTTRLLYALLADDIDGYRLAVDELDDCPECMRKALYAVTRHWAGSMVLSAGGRDKAAEGVLVELGRVLMQVELGNDFSATLLSEGQDGGVNDEHA
jgi:hypothetical protein